MNINLSLRGTTVASGWTSANVFPIYFMKFNRDNGGKLPLEDWNNTSVDYIYYVKNELIHLNLNDITTIDYNSPTNIIFNPRINLLLRDSETLEYSYEGDYITWLYTELGGDYNSLRIYSDNNPVYTVDFTDVTPLDRSGLKTSEISAIYLVYDDNNGSLGTVRPIAVYRNNLAAVLPVIQSQFIESFEPVRSDVSKPVKEQPPSSVISTSTGVFNVGVGYIPTRHTKYIADDFPNGFSVDDTLCSNMRDYLVYDFYDSPTGILQLVSYGAVNTGGSCYRDIEGNLQASLLDYNKDVIPATNFIGYKEQVSGNFVPFLSGNTITFDDHMFPFDFVYYGNKITVDLTSNGMTFSSPFGQSVTYKISDDMIKRQIWSFVNIASGYLSYYIVKVSNRYELWMGCKWVASDIITHGDIEAEYNCGIYAVAVLPQWMKEFFDEAGIAEGGVGENNTTESLVEEELGGELGTGELAPTIDDSTEWNPHDGTMGHGTGNVHGGDTEIPDPADDLPTPGGEGSVLGTGFIKVYTPSQTQLNSFTSELLSDDALDVLKRFFASNPMDGIIGLHMIPYTGFSSTNTGNPKIGTYEFDAALNIAGKEYLTIDYGNITIDFAYDGYENYSAYSDCKIFLPHIGYKEIDIDMIQGCKINLKYNVSLVTGDIYAYLYATWVAGSHDGGESASTVKHLLYHWQGNCAMQVPITHVDKSNIINAGVQAVGSMVSLGTGLATGGVGAVIGASAGLNAIAESSRAFKPSVVTSGSISGSAAYMSAKTPYLLMSRPIIVGEEDIKHHYGRIAAKRVTISELRGTGFTTLDSVDLNGVTATEEELDELKSIMEGGFYA